MDKSRPVPKLLPLILIVFLGIVIYSNIYANSFHFDDFPQIVNDPAIRNIGDLSAIWGHWPTRFVTDFSFALNYHWGGASVSGYHILSLIIHIMTSILVWRLMLLTLNLPVIRTEPVTAFAPWIAFFTSLIFLTHPLQTQSINYVVQRSVLLAAFFYIASLILYIKANLAWEAKMAIKRGQFYYIGSLVCAVLSVLSKENAASLPLMICFYQWFFFKESKAFHWKGIFPFFIVILIMPLAWGTLNFQMFMRAKDLVKGFSQGMGLQQYTLTQGGVILTYLKLLILPFHQRFEYDFTLATFFSDIHAIGSWLLLLLILGIAVALRNRFRLLSFGIFWFFITLIPESSFWPIKDLIFEHRLYLPLLGFGVFLSSGLFYLFQGEKSSFAIRILFLIVVGYSILTYQRNKIWKNEFTLWDDAVHQSPNSSRAYLNRGAAYQMQGDLDHALEDYNMALGLGNGQVNAIILNNRGIIFSQRGFFDLALANYSLAIKIDPSYRESYFNRAIAYFYLHDYDKSWEDEHKAESMGFRANQQLLDGLKAVSKR